MNWNPQSRLWWVFIGLVVGALALWTVAPLPGALLLYGAGVFALAMLARPPIRAALRWSGAAQGEHARWTQHPAARLLPALEVLAVLLVSLWATQHLFDPHPDMQLGGGEMQWLTSSVYLAHAGLRDYGSIPLWQPFLEFGEPLIENPFGFVLNPLSAAPALVWGWAYGIKTSVILYAAFAALGGWWLGVVLHLRAPARLLLAALVLGKGNMLAMIGAGFVQLGVTQAYFPWVIAAALLTLRTPRRYPPVLLALLLTLMLWAGNIWYLLPTLATVGLLTLTHGFLCDGKRVLWGALARMALAAALTVGLSAVYLLPLGAHARYIGDHLNDLPGGGMVADAGRVLAHFVRGGIELYLTDDAAGAPQFYHSFVTPLWFLALMTVLLLPLPGVRALLPPPALPHAPRVWGVGLVVLVLCTLWGIGGTGIWVLLYNLFPALGQWRFVGRALAVASFWLAVLLALRFDLLWRVVLARVNPPGLRLNLAGVLLGVGAAAAYPVVQQWHDFARPLAMTSYFEQRCLNWLRDVEPDAPLAVNLVGYAAITPFLAARVREFSVEADYRPLPDPNTVGSYDLRRLLPEYWMPFGRDALAFVRQQHYTPVPGSPVVAGQDPCLYRNAAYALPYAFSAPRLTLVNVAAPEEFLNAPWLTPITALERRYDAVRLWVQASADRSQVVVVLETAYPGWQVLVDGVPARLEVVGGMIGVVLRADGRMHEVIFAFRPPLFYAGGALTLGTALLAALLLGVPRGTGSQNPLPGHMARAGNADRNTDLMDM